MILTILMVVITVIGIVMLRKSEYDGIAYWLGLLFAVSGVVMAVGMTICIICAHVGVDAVIEKNRIEYESLCQRYEIITSEYEDVSKSDVIKDIAEWNKEIYSYKYWANNPWTSWFYSKRVADSVEMIDIEGVKE